ncbi:hypothetical protein [Rhodovulum sulfidophilum]|uniref:hypothetical protein n=1 Tax=Rhodovulum sulfidophilum TaxID=35806 RepID=UPI001923CF9E|nr:hypothetical protein [Rhodovulum sulfidophilum]MBL3554580.1 hypothetical protein [Rhodovulum sulfidophilum]
MTDDPLDRVRATFAAAEDVDMGDIPAPDTAIPTPRTIRAAARNPRTPLTEPPPKIRSGRSGRRPDSR